ncbi:hypothetical protein [Halorussus ruber]|uniref:hypothetical protein n=1 Tax=Halorussus ruber TaxID=1126238 RepID=UPI001092F9BE|nr:hypothetical protein [Halorussus ruber]
MTDETEEILDNARTTLQTAYRGYKQFQQGEGQTKLIGLRNAVVFGRSVTFVLQKLRGIYGRDFDEWYAWREKVFREDEVCRRISEMRNEILKEGEASVSNYAKISATGQEIRSIAPPEAKSIFIGDQYGGSGYTIETRDGEEKKFYVKIPDGIEIETGLLIPELDSPGDAEDDIRYYIKLMAETVSDARTEFGNQDQ